MIRILMILLMILAVFLIVMIAVDSNRFVTVHYSVETGKCQKGVRLVFLSDLHGKCFGEGNEKLLSAIEKAKPELIVIGGDMITATTRHDAKSALSLIEKLRGKYPVYYGSGNHEQRLKLYPENYPGASEHLENALREMGVIRLQNSSESAEEYGIEFSSVEIEREYYKRSRPPMLTKEKMLEYLPEKKDENAMQILLAHNPDYFEAYRQWGADLVLAGHVHGGIVRLPWLGGVISPKLTLFPKYDGGEFEEENAKMIISRGLGSHTIPWRLFNPGELVVIDVR